MVNDKLETSAPGVWALGDIKGGPAFTHISYDDYRVLKANIIDSGAGVDPEARERIFDRFYRAANVPAGATGAGLGLSIAKSAVEANGGRLTLAASGTNGSTFRIALPRAAPTLRRAVG